MEKEKCPMKGRMSQCKEGECHHQPIEEKWKETLEDLWWGSFDNDGEKNSHEYEKMVSFIENLLEQERKRMSDEIGKRIKEESKFVGEQEEGMILAFKEAKAIINK